MGYYGKKGSMKGIEEVMVPTRQGMRKARRFSARFSVSEHGEMVVPKYSFEFVQLTGTIFARRESGGDIGYYCTEPIY
jgi:hypothetical protein